MQEFSRSIIHNSKKQTQKNISGKIVMSIVVELINDGSHTMECYSVIRKKTTSTCNDVDKT